MPQISKELVKQTIDALECMVDDDNQASIILKLQRLLDQPEPTLPTNSQDWKGMDGSIAFHLIERHAENWSDTGKMMGDWLAANQAAQPEGEPVAWTTMPEAEDWCFISGANDPNKTLSGKWFPLYTHPAPFTPITADMVTDWMHREWNKVFENNPHIKDGEIIAAAVNAWGSKK
jgi:hypothetical protein